MKQHNIVIICESEADLCSIRASLARAQPDRFNLIEVTTHDQPVEAMENPDHDAVILAFNHETEYLLRRAKKGGAGKPVIVLIDHEGKELVGKLKENGAADYLVRGMLSDDLLHRVLDYNLALVAASGSSVPGAVVAVVSEREEESVTPVPESEEPVLQPLDDLRGELQDQMREQRWQQLKNTEWKPAEKEPVEPVPEQTLPSEKLEHPLDVLRDQLQDQAREQQWEQLRNDEWKAAQEEPEELSVELAQQSAQVQQPLPEEMPAPPLEQLRDQLQDHLRDQEWEQLKSPEWESEVDEPIELELELPAQESPQTAPVAPAEVPLEHPLEALRDQLREQQWEQAKEPPLQNTGAGDGNSEAAPAADKRAAVSPTAVERSIHATRKPVRPVSDLAARNNAAKVASNGQASAPGGGDAQVDPPANRSGLVVLALLLAALVAAGLWLTQPWRTEHSTEPALVAIPASQPEPGPAIKRDSETLPPTRAETPVESETRIETEAGSGSAVDSDVVAAIETGTPAELETQTVSETQMELEMPAESGAATELSGATATVQDPALVEDDPPLGNWFVNLGTFSREERALAWVDSISTDEGRIQVLAVDGGTGTLYRVQIVDLPDFSTATAVAHAWEDRLGLSKLWVGERSIQGQ